MSKSKSLTRKPFGQSVDVQVSIQPYIETVRWAENRIENYLRFDVAINKTHLNQYEAIAWFCIADGIHWGEQSGPEWEQLQLHWQKQYDYLKEYLEHAVAHTSIYLCGEACISHRNDWDFTALLSETTMTELEELVERHARADDKSGAWKWGERFHFQPIQLASFHARHVWERLKHEDEEDKHLNIETPIGNFFDNQHDKVLNQYAEYTSKWKTARKIIKANPNEKEWRNILSQVYEYFHFPEDLLESLHETVADKNHKHLKRPKWNPSEIALVHLARDAWLLNKDGSRLEAAQWHSVKRAMDAYSIAKGKPKLKIEQ